MPRLVVSLQYKNGTHSGITASPHLVKSYPAIRRSFFLVLGLVWSCIQYVGNVWLTVFYGGDVGVTDSALELLIECSELQDVSNDGF